MRRKKGWVRSGVGETERERLIICAKSLLSHVNQCSVYGLCTKLNKLLKMYMLIRELLGNIKELLLKLLCIIMILWLFF